MRYLFSLGLILLFYVSIQAQLPSGFNREKIFETEFSFPAGILPVDSNTYFVYELSGLIWAVVDGEKAEQPVLDLTDEVGFWAENGLLGATLDKNFRENGYLYLLYNVDRHHFLYFGTEEYDPEASIGYQGGMGRITRYTVETSNYLSVVPDSRKVLLGETVETGIPLSSDSHSTGSIIMGNDGSIVATCGDGSTYFCCYNGEGDLPPAAYDSTSYQDGILSPEEMVGSFKSQLVNGLNGKIIRIHPETGEGLPNNPFFDPENPNADRSKVWALGFRNPFRTRIRPNSGGGTLESGNPGVIYAADVGHARWEELNIIREGGGNYGWPIFEGHELFDGEFPDLPTPNLHAPNPLSANESCDQEYFTFQDLIQQENRQHDYYFPNPCDPAQPVAGVPTFAHERPAMAYRNIWGGSLITAFPDYTDDGEAIWVDVDNFPDVDGENFRGTSVIGGDFIYGESIPSEYQNHYLLADYMGWIKAVEVDDNDEIVRIEHWIDSIGRPVDITFNTYDGCVYITSLWPTFIERICFGGNLRPVVKLAEDTLYGQSPLEVTLDASESFDPEGGPLEFSWDFGDGSTGTGQTVSHTYSGSGTISYTATITATDTAGASNDRTVLISLNNTPPDVNIASIIEGELYSVQFPTTFDLNAIVDDAEHRADEMTYTWQHLLRHNSHFHLINEFDFENGSTIIYPTGCLEDEVYWYELNVTVTDPGGLTAFDSRMIYPDCEGELDSIRGIQGINIFPNPTENDLTVVSGEDLGEEVEILVYDMTGNLIRSDVLPIFNDRKFFNIDLENISNGIYHLEIRYSGKNLKKRFVKI